MIIQRMNNTLVKHSKILFGIFTAVIIVSFVWFFTPGIDGSLLFGGGISETTTYGTFFDKKITYGDINAAMRQLSMISRYGDPSDEQAFSYVIQKMGADKIGVTVSDEELRTLLQQLPDFQEDGKFSVAKYREFSEKMLEPRGFSVADFENAWRDILRVEKASEQICSSVTMSDTEFKQVLGEKLEKFTFRFVQFTPERLSGDVKVNPEELKSFFQANKEDFLPPARVDGVIAVALNTAFKSPVSQDAIKAYYDKHKDEFKGKDGKVKSLKAVSAEITKKIQAEDGTGAKKAMETFCKNIRALTRTEEYKTDFEKLFRKAAQDAGFTLVDVKDAAVDGSFFAANVDPAALSALSKLKRAGSFTSPVFGTDGCRISLLTARREFKDTTYEEAHARVEQAYRLSKARELLVPAAESFRTQLAQSKDQAKDLEAVARKNKGNVIKFPAVLSRMDVESNPYTVQLRGTLFDTKAGTLSQPRISEDAVVMIFVDKREAASTDDFKKAAENPDIRKYLLNEKKGHVFAEYSYWLQSNSHITTPAKRNQTAKQ